MTTSNDPDEIRAEIEYTRAALSDDVDALADTANPKKIAQRQVDKAKDAVVGVKDRGHGYRRRRRRHRPGQGVSGG